MLKHLVSLVAVVVALAFTEPTPAVAQSGGGCDQYCSAPWCQWGGTWGSSCVQGYLGGDPNCTTFWLSCLRAGDDMKPKKTTLFLEVSMAPASQCEQAAATRAERAVGHFYRSDLFKGRYRAAEYESVRLEDIVQPRIVATGG